MGYRLPLLGRDYLCIRIGINADENPESLACPKNVSSVLYQETAQVSVPIDWNFESFLRSSRWKKWSVLKSSDPL